MANIASKTKPELLTSVLNSLEKNAGIKATSPGSVARAYAEAITNEIGNLYDALQYFNSQTMLSTATGRSLDLIGALYGVSRRTTTTSSASDFTTANVTFTLNTLYSSTLTIPANTLIYNDVTGFASKQYNYKLANDVVFLPGVTLAYGIVIPAFDDSSFSAPRGTLTRHNFVAPAGVIVSVINSKEVSATLNTETDANFRNRIARAVKANSGGTVESIRLAGLTVNNVKDVRLREGSFGLGSCDVIIVPENPNVTSTLVDSVAAQISKVKPVGIRFNVRLATRIPVAAVVNIYLSLNYGSDVNTSITKQSEAFLRRYLNSLSIGDTLSITEIENAVKSSSSLISRVSISSLIVDGAEIPRQDFKLNSYDSYMVAGAVSVQTAVVGQNNY